MFWSELTGSATRLRTKIALGMFAALPLLLAIGLKASSGPLPADSPPFINSIRGNGVYVPLAALALIAPLLLPLVVCVIAGDAIAGDADIGTLRYMLAWPTGRSRLVIVKYLVVLCFCAVIAIAIWLVGLIAGGSLYGLGPLVTSSGATMGVASGALRTLLAAGIVTANMAAIGAIGVFASALTESPLGAAAAAFGAFILSTVLDGISQLADIHPLLLTHYALSFTSLVGASPGEAAGSGVGADLLVQVAYVTVFLAAAIVVFRRRDVLS